MRHFSEEDKQAVDAGNITPLSNALVDVMTIANRTRNVQVERTRRLERLTEQVAGLSAQAERDAIELEELRAEVERLRRVNHETAQRAFYLQPGLRVRIGQHYGTVQEKPVMVPVLLDNSRVLGRFDSKFVHLVHQVHVTDGASVIGVADLHCGPGTVTARNIRLTRNAEETPLPGDATPRPPFHHQVGSPSDYLEALAEELCHGWRNVTGISTHTNGDVLQVTLGFDVPDERGQLDDLHYVAER